MTKRPDRFTEVWILDNEDGTTTILHEYPDVSIYNQTYIGRLYLSSKGLVFAHNIEWVQEERHIHCLPIAHKKAKEIDIIKSEVTWDNGVVSFFWCEPEKYMEGKVCYSNSEDHFTFGTILKRVSLHEFIREMPVGRMEGGGVTCAI